MSSWKSNALSRLKKSGRITARTALLGSLLVGASLNAAPPKPATEQDHLQASITLRVVLINITSYRDMQEIRAALAQAEGMQRITLDSEAPGLITFNLRYAGEPLSLIDKLNLFFSKKYNITQKNISSGTAEIDISNK